jgi:nitroreductase
MSPRTVLELIRNRVSAEDFDPERTLSDDEIRALVADATEAPSSFNIQHWRFVAVTRREDKQRLQDAAFGQRQVADAAVTFIILGDLAALDVMPEVMKLAVERGALPEGKASAWLRLAAEIYGDEQMTRDEAIRSCSLAAMTMMLAAEARGLCAGALTGFDPAKLREAFDIDERYLPVMLLAVGHPASRGESRKPRLAVDRVLSFGRARFGKGDG